MAGGGCCSVCSWAQAYSISEVTCLKVERPEFDVFSFHGVCPGNMMLVLEYHCTNSAGLLLGPGITFIRNNRLGPDGLVAVAQEIIKYSHALESLDLR
jgi:hypothetical protein